MRLQNISCRSQTYITVHFKADFRNCKYSYEWTKVYFKGVDVHIPQSFVYRVLVRCNSTHGTKSYKRALKESKADVPEFNASLHTFSPLLRNISHFRHAFVYTFQVKCVVIVIFSLPFTHLYKHIIFSLYLHNPLLLNLHMYNRSHICSI